MPLADMEVRSNLACGVGSDGHMHGWFDVRVHGEALRRIGLHPDQPTANVDGSTPPAWWHAAAERNAH